MIRLGNIVDVLQRADECIVLTPDQCLRLSAVPTVILGFVSQPRSRADVDRHLESVFGPAPAGRIDEIIGELINQGVLRVGADDVPSDDVLTIS